MGAILMEKRTITSADCGVVNCDVQNKNYPPFCLTTHMDEEIKSEALKLYEDKVSKQRT